MTQISKDAPARSSAIVDSPKVMIYLLAAVGSPLLACLLAYIVIVAPPGDKNVSIQVFLACLAVLFGIVSVMSFNVNRKGYVINVESDIFEFPGGGIVADSWLSYFTPAFIFQEFKRHQIPLSAIREIQAYQDTSIKEEKDFRGRRRLRTTEKAKLDLSGDFGAISFTLWSKGKRDQLHSAIVSINKMGDPMLRR